MTATPQASPHPAATMPPRWPPLLYFGFAHLCLAAAFATAALDPRGVGGFFYHPRMLAVVHLVTLGWIGSSVLGAIYVVGPLAFRMPLPVGRVDYAAFGSYAVGVLGLVGHFWTDTPAGSAWTAGLVGLALIRVAVRAIAGLRHAPVPREVRLPVALAFANVLIAAGLGLLLALNKEAAFLTVPHLDVVFAHAHLAALGWGALIVVGAGYRILPMILPAAMPRGAWVYASALLIEAGVLGLAVGFLWGRGLELSALVATAGLGVFLSQVVWMLRHQRPAPSAMRRPDWGTWHVLQALGWLAVAGALGLTLAASAPSEAGLRMAMAYGVAGLVGFLSQMIVGVEARVLPLFGWLWGFADRAYADAPPSLHEAPVRGLQAAGFALWTIGVPLLAWGLAMDRPPLVAAAAAGLLAAVVASFLNAVVVLRRLWGGSAG